MVEIITSKDMKNKMCHKNSEDLHKATEGERISSHESLLQKQGNFKDTKKAHSEWSIIKQNIAISKGHFILGSELCYSSSSPFNLCILDQKERMLLSLAFILM